MHSITMFATYLLTTLLLMTVGSESVAPKEPPSTYELSDVTIRLDKYLGGRSSIVFEISGTGSGRVKGIGYQGTVERCAFQLDTEEVLDLINSFHGIYFFDLAERYSFPYQAVLGGDGEVQTKEISQSHGGGSTVTIQIRDYTKTSGFYVKGPRQLVWLAKHIANVSETACVDSESN